MTCAWRLHALCQLLDVHAWTVRSLLWEYGFLRQGGVNLTDITGEGIPNMSLAGPVLLCLFVYHHFHSFTLPHSQLCPLSYILSRLPRRYATVCLRRKTQNTMIMSWTLLNELGTIRNESRTSPWRNFFPFHHSYQDPEKVSHRIHPHGSSLHKCFPFHMTSSGPNHRTSEIPLVVWQPKQVSEGVFPSIPSLRGCPTLCSGMYLKQRITGMCLILTRQYRFLGLV